MIFEYGAMSSKYSCEAENKLTAYCVMLLHYNNSNHLVAIYSPEECKEDSWLNPFGKISDRLDEIFGGKGSLDLYLEKNKDDIVKCYDSIIQLI